MKRVFFAGLDAPMALVVPPGMVHPCKNVGMENGIVFNGPNRLYAGPGKRERVAGKRQEEMPDSPFGLD